MPLLVTEYIHILTTHMDVHLTRIAQVALLRKQVQQRRNLRIQVDLRMPLAQKAAHTPVHAEQHHEVVAMQDVIPHLFMRSSGMVEIQHLFGQLVFEKFQRHQGKAMGSHQHIDPPVGTRQLLLLLEDTPQIGSQWQRLVHGPVFAHRGAVLLCQRIEHREGQAVRIHADGQSGLS